MSKEEWRKRILKKRADLYESLYKERHNLLEELVTELKKIQVGTLPETVISSIDKWDRRKT